MSERRVSAREAIDSGLLHCVNEAMLWPKGFTLSIVAEAQPECGNVGEDGNCAHEGRPHNRPTEAGLDRPAQFVLYASDEAYRTAYPEPAHGGFHRAFEALEDKP